ncbi:hypothetical protein BgAZ_109210 [Babesia gibsoni]|uniref:Uncharacterized protein n=1 Tax=Babesia gibsoni TaxID=33632 RepID=A0AAD8USL4_BABGI|nr:hypothetical protein BgAZ_109210 [Babesia gibsoni]
MYDIDFNEAAQNAQGIAPNQQEEYYGSQTHDYAHSFDRRSTGKMLVIMLCAHLLSVNRIAMVKPEKATQIENYLLQTVAASGRRTKMSDDELRNLIENMSGGNTGAVSNIKIRRKRWNDDSDSEPDLDV